MDYKTVIINHRKEINTLCDYFLSEPMSTLEEKIEEEFEKRDGYVNLKRYDTRFKLDGWVYERKHTFDCIIRLNDKSVFCNDLHKLARDLVVADCTERTKCNYESNFRSD